MNMLLRVPHRGILLGPPSYEMLHEAYNEGQGGVYVILVYRDSSDAHKLKDRGDIKSLGYSKHAASIILIVDKVVRMPAFILVSLRSSSVRGTRRRTVLDILTL
jgi:hypothetical protein